MRRSVSSSRRNGRYCDRSAPHSIASKYGISERLIARLDYRDSFSWPALAALYFLQSQPRCRTINRQGIVPKQRDAMIVKVHPVPMPSNRICSTETPMAATLQRIMLTEALAVAGASGWRSTIKVLQTCIDSLVRPVEEAEGQGDLH